GDTAGPRIAGMNLEVRPFFNLEKYRKVGEGRVQRIAGGRGQHRERISRRKIRIGRCGFPRRRECRERVEPLRSQRFGIKLAFSGWRRKIALGEGRKGGRNVEALPTRGLERVPIEPAP